jgi:hypothetical protein
MSYYSKNRHLQHISGGFHSGNSTLTYGAVVGTYQNTTDRPIQGRNGDHLQFYLSVAQGEFYQVDVNTQSRDGSEVGVYIAEEALQPTEDAGTGDPFGTPTLGVDASAALSYKAMGLTNANFVLLPYTRIESQLEADLAAAKFVSAYGMMFDDGGANGKGIHEIHFNPTAPGAPDQDGALALYSVDSGTKALKRTWYFFKFQGDRIG